MKKIALALIPLALSLTFAAKAQTETNEKSAVVSKSQDNNTQTKSPLDGKSFKITLTAKVPETKTGTESGSADPSVAPGVNSKTGMGENKDQTEVAGKSPIESTDAGMQTQSAIDGLSKANLKFEDQTIKISFLNETPNVETCSYHITSGKASFVTFTGNCGSRMSTIKVDETKNAASTGSGIAVGEISTEPTATQTPSTAMATASITGLVNGNEISGTLILNKDGKRINYSYKGTLDKTKVKKNEDLGSK